MFNRNYQTVSLIWLRTNKNRFQESKCQTNSCMCNGSESELFMPCFTFCHMKIRSWKLNIDGSYMIMIWFEFIGISPEIKTSNLKLEYDIFFPLTSKGNYWRAEPNIVRIHETLRFYSPNWMTRREKKMHIVDLVDWRFDQNRKRFCTWKWKRKRKRNRFLLIFYLTLNCCLCGKNSIKMHKIVW